MLEAPSAAHLFGTDSIGRDVAARLVLGARSSVFVAVVATVVTLVIGTLIAVASAYLGGVVDWVAMRIVDIFLSIPPLLTAIAVLAAVGPSIPTLLSVLVITYLPARSVDTLAALQVCERGYINSARISRVGAARIMLVHIIPNVVAFSSCRRQSRWPACSSSRPSSAFSAWAFSRRRQVSVLWSPRDVSGWNWRLGWWLPRAA